jgi:hypothetical protein
MEVPFDFISVSMDKTFSTGATDDAEATAAREGATLSIVFIVTYDARLG